MPKMIEPGAKARYRATHPVISLQVTKAEYDLLDRIRKVSGKGWADIMRRSIQVPSTEEGKYTMERCIDAEERIKVLEAQLNNSVNSRFKVVGCNVHRNFVHSFDLSNAEDRARLNGIVSNAMRATEPCPICNGRNRYSGR